MMSVKEFQRLRPRQIAEEVKAFPTAYLPIGILEWHSFHNPYGLDGLKAHGIATRLAQEIGGLIMPTVFWGDHRAEICERHLDRVDQHGTNAADVMCKTLDIPRDAFARDADRSVDHGGWQLFEALIEHSLFQIETYGFQAIVIIPGHYPLFPAVQNAMSKYGEKGGHCKLWMLHDGKFSETGRGDHAAEYETSLLMAIAPELVDLNELSSDLSLPPVGTALGKDPRTHASKEKGEAALVKMVQFVREELA